MDTRAPRGPLNDTENLDFIVDTMSFGEIIRKARGRNYSQRELAKKANLSNSTISRIENGAPFEIEVKGLYKISRVLHLNFFEMFGTLYPSIRNDYQDIFEIIELIEALSINDRKYLLDIFKALVLYRELDSKGIYKVLHETMQEK